MTKSDQLRALREARLKKPNQFEDAARGRDPAPKKSRGTAVEGAISKPTPATAGPRETKSKARSQAVKAVGFDPATAGSNPAAPTKSGGGAKARRRAVTPEVSDTAPATGQSAGERRPPEPNKRPVGRPKIEGPRPWDVLGISRRTYYRSRESEK